jgi:glutamyl-tRNA reductase
MSANLDDLKKVAESHMQKEVEIMEMVMELDNNDIELFHRWYINHPYSKGIRELQQIVRNKTD